MKVLHILFFKILMKSKKNFQFHFVITKLASILIGDLNHNYQTLIPLLLLLFLSTQRAVDFEVYFSSQLIDYMKRFYCIHVFGIYAIYDFDPRI